MEYMENNHTIDGKPTQDRRKTLAGYLASALNMEDEISNGIYLDYLKTRNWPGTISHDTFREIATRLTVLIDDTKKHRKIIEALLKDHG